MATPTYDPDTGRLLPSYYVFNNDEHLPPEKSYPMDEPAPLFNAIIYDMKANSTTDGLIHGNIYTQFANGSISLLADERVVKEKLLGTEKGRRMDPFTLRKYLLPYEMTSRLIDEINNLKLKQVSGMSNQTKVEQINTSIPKDRFSSLEYGLWRIKYYEDEAMRKRTRRGDIKDFILYKPRTRR